MWYSLAPADVKKSNRHKNFFIKILVIFLNGHQHYQYEWKQQKSEYAELIFETHLVPPSWEDQTSKWGFFIITHEIIKPWYSFKKKVVKKS